MAAAIAVSRHWTQKIRLINGRIVRQHAQYAPRLDKPAAPPSPRGKHLVRALRLPHFSGSGRAIVRVMVAADQQNRPTNVETSRVTPLSSTLTRFFRPTPIPY